MKIRLHSKFAIYSINQSIIGYNFEIKIFIALFSNTTKFPELRVLLKNPEQWITHIIAHLHHIPISQPPKGILEKRVLRRPTKGLTQVNVPIVVNVIVAHVAVEHPEVLVCPDYRVITVVPGLSGVRP